MMPKESRLALLEVVANVSDEIRLLISLSATGRCPFCLGDLSIDSPTIAAIKRGHVGEALKAEIARRERAAADEGCAPDGHALDCRLQQSFKELEP